MSEFGYLDQKLKTGINRNSDNTLLTFGRPGLAGLKENEIPVTGIVERTNG